MKSVTHSIFKTFLLSVLVVAQMHFAYAQTASILPPAKTTFLDANGKPLTAGTVESFIPTTSTHKTTWQDAAETIPNANPLTLDAAGRALLLGSGSYRQVVKDRLNNVIWDQVTSSTGSGGGGGSTATGDGDLVGTIKPWAGMTAPNQYVFTYGQEISRTTFSALFTAITSIQNIFCNSGSPILNGLSDTTNFWIGMPVELSCVAPGFTTIIAKTATTVTLALNSNVTTNTAAVFFPWGRGNGVTTFNVPDFRGFAIAGNNIMGGTASSNLTTAFFGAAGPDSSGAAGGNQSKTVLLSNLPVITSTNSAQSITVGNAAVHIPFANANWAQTSTFATTGATIGAFTAGSVGDTTTFVGSNSISVTSSVAGGIAVSATIGAAGAGYTNGVQLLTVAGGTCTIQPTFNTTVAGNIITNPLTLVNAGNCTVPPTNPAATTGGGGTGGTINIVYSALPFGLVQPTKTSNYIIKITPDDNSATASGVTALGGMTGSIACGTNLTCSGNTISVVNGPTFSGATTINAPLVVNNTIAAGTTTLTTTNANALVVGANGATNPAFNVDASTGSQVAGLNIKGAAIGGTVSLSAIDSGANTNLQIKAKGAGTITLQADTGSTTTVNVGVAASTNGQLVIAGATSGATTVAPTAIASGTLTLPALTATLTATIASGAKALATGAIGSATCTAAQTDTATGAVTTDVLSASFAADPTAVTGYIPLTTGMLTIIPYLTANTANFKVCNNTLASITPGAITINWRVVR